MVRAILDGRKSQTRRIIKPQPQEVGFGKNATVKPYCTGTDWPLAYYEMRGSCWNSSKPLKCRHGQPGDRLWVRETWCCKMDDGTYVYRQDGHHECLYRATEQFEIRKDDGNGGTEYRKDGTQASPWSPSIYMPRWASRITLEITGVRVERLQDISEQDAKAEGVLPEFEIDIGTFVHNQKWNPESASTYRLGYKHLWNEINGNGSWDKNPWVWVIELKRL